MSKEGASERRRFQVISMDEYVTSLGIPVADDIKPEALWSIEAKLKRGEDLGTAVAEQIVEEAEMVGLARRSRRALDDVSDSEVLEVVATGLVVVTYMYPAQSLLTAKHVVSRGEPQPHEDNPRGSAILARAEAVMKEAFPETGLRFHLDLVARAELEVKEMQLGSLLRQSGSDRLFIDLVSARLQSRVGDDRFVRTVLERGVKRFHGLYETAEKVL